MTECITSVTAALQIWITIWILPPAPPMPLERCMAVVVVLEDMLLLLLTRKTLEPTATHCSCGCRLSIS